MIIGEVTMVQKIKFLTDFLFLRIFKALKKRSIVERKCLVIIGIVSRTISSRIEEYKYPTQSSTIHVHFKLGY